MKIQTIFDDWSEESKQNFNDWVDYYRKNIHRFAIEYLGLQLAPFQQILLYCMANPETNSLSTFDFFASRGLDSGCFFVTQNLWRVYEKNKRTYGLS